VAWGTALSVGIGSLFGARIGARAAARTSARGLRLAFALFLAAVAFRLLWKVPEVAPLRVGTAPMLALDLGLGLAVGVLAGYMGVGGGALAVPAFTMLLGMPQQMAQGTSLAVILFAAPAGAIEHARHGHLLLHLVPGLAVGAAIGALAASWWVQGLPHAVLARAFGLFLLATATMTAVRAVRSLANRPPTTG
jgi:uncharacterized membrane protein YfcA